MESKQQPQRVWAAIVYPESAPEDWLSVLAGYHIPMAISPLHVPDDDEKKPHHHILVHFEGKKSRTQVKEIFDIVHGVVSHKPVGSIGGYARYMCHIDNPEKEQLDVRDVVCLSGFDYRQYLVPSGTKLKELEKEIDTFVLDNQITEVADLVKIALESEPEWYDILQIPSYLSRVNRLITSMRHGLVPQD